MSRYQVFVCGCGISFAIIMFACSVGLIVYLWQDLPAMEVVQNLD